jgi:hypothetical protein
MLYAVCCVCLSVSALTQRKWPVMTVRHVVSTPHCILPLDRALLPAGERRGPVYLAFIQDIMEHRGNKMASTPSCLAGRLDKDGSLGLADFTLFAHFASRPRCPERRLFTPRRFQHWKPCGTWGPDATGRSVEHAWMTCRCRSSFTAVTRSFSRACHVGRRNAITAWIHAVSTPTSTYRTTDTSTTGAKDCSIPSLVTYGTETALRDLGKSSILDERLGYL